MDLFADEITEEIYRTRFSTCAPEHVVVAAHRAVHLLLAASRLNDIRFAGVPVRFRNRPGEFGVVIDEKWHVTFRWDDRHGAHTLKFERRKPTSTGEMETNED